jgi:hypothetical protein
MRTSALCSILELLSDMETAVTSLVEFGPFFRVAAYFGL